jgi:transcription elongation factor GreA
MTAQGAKQLEQTLYALKTEARPRIIKSIEEARAHGDLKENAEYHAAKEEQGFVERRILEIEAKLSQSQIIEVGRLANTGRVVFGATVYLINAESGEKLIYQIVGEDEADIKLNKISFNSPFARALIGKTVGDAVEVKTPSGEQCFEIDKVDYI